MTENVGLVLFGDVVGSRQDAAGSTAWLRDLVVELDEAYGDERLAAFGFTQGDELQGLLGPTADPLLAVLRAALGPGGRRVRWVVVRGEVDADPAGARAPATERTGPAFILARKAIDEARASHERLVIVTGQADVDALLADLVPALVDMLDGLTERQRTVARLALVENLRQSEVAERLRVRRATISVSFNRARVRSLQRLVAGIRRVYSSGLADPWRAATESVQEAQAARGVEP
jgi:DNA-directed RNA polymerase specialized sigma24 family protein